MLKMGISLRDSELNTEVEVIMLTLLSQDNSRWTINKYVSHLHKYIMAIAIQAV